MIPRCWFPGYCDGSRRQYYDWLRRWNNGSSQKLLRVGIPTCIHRWQCNCKEVMSLFVARSGLWLRRNLKFLYSEFGVYRFYRMLKSKKVGTVQIRMCGRSKDGTYRNHLSTIGRLLPAQSGNGTEFKQPRCVVIAGFADRHPTATRPRCTT